VRVAIGAYAGTLGGPRSYGLGLIRALAEEFPRDEWVVISDRPEAFEDLDLQCERVSFPAKVLRPAVEHSVLPRIIRSVAPDLYHGTKQGLPPRLRCPGVATVHDLAFFTMPETFPPASRLFLRREARSSVKRAARIVVPSESTKRDMVAIIGADANRVDVVHNGVADEFHHGVSARERTRVKRRYGLPRRYVVSHGTLQPRKNPGRLLDAFVALRRSGRATDVDLVFAGRRGWMIGPFMRKLNRLGGEHGVRLLESIPDEDVAPLVAGAEVFASPTAYEGFGLSIAEAMALGVPVIAGGGSSVPEVVGRAGVLVDVEDDDALRDALGSLLEDGPRRERLGEAARKRASRFTWRAAARRMRGAYARAIESAS
jgi:glycosyltransferase involved in cell wall biosynthesis